jgi:hypothetical protein
MLRLSHCLRAEPRPPHMGTLSQCSRDRGSARLAAEGLPSQYPVSPGRQWDTRARKRGTNEHCIDYHRPSDAGATRRERATRRETFATLAGDATTEPILSASDRGDCLDLMTKRAQVEAVMRSHDRSAHVRLVALSGQAQSAL